MKSLFAVLLLALSIGWPVQAATPGDQEPAAPAPSSSTRPTVPVLYVLQYRPGPVWRTGRPLSEQGLEQHGLYMRELAARGEILAAGPLSTIEGGLVILRVDSLEIAIARMEADPAIITGKFVGEATVWRPGIDPAGRFAAPAP